jgi:hypothetical protein
MIAHRGAGRAAFLRAKLFERNSRHFDVQINSIQQGAADLCHVAFNLRNRAMALTARIVAIAARAGVERGNEHEIGRKRRGIERAADRNVTIFKRLTENFECCSIELRQFV